MAKKKLLLITNGFPFGESERGFLPAEFECLNEAFDVYVLARTDNQPESAWENVDKERVQCTGNPPLRIVPVLLQAFRWSVIRELARAMAAGGGVRLFARRVSAILRYSARASMYQEKIESICNQKGIDMIYTYWCTQATLAALRVKQKHPGMKVVTRFHGYDLYQERTQELWQPFRYDIAHKGELLVFVCKTGREYFLSHWKNTDPAKTLVSYLGCRPMERVSGSDEKMLTVVSCSNVIALKRVDYIIDALAILPENIKISWHHFGDGVLRKTLEERAQEKLSGKENIFWNFHGAVPNSQLDACYRTLHPDVFITTSATEGVPVSIQEAFAMGIPAIGTAVGGIPELIIPGKTGWLLPADPTIQQVAQAIATAAALAQRERQDLREETFQYWKNNFNSKQTAEGYVRRLVSMESDGKE